MLERVVTVAFQLTAFGSRKPPAKAGRPQKSKGLVSLLMLLILQSSGGLKNDLSDFNKDCAMIGCKPLPFATWPFANVFKWLCMSFGVQPGIHPDYPTIQSILIQTVSFVVINTGLNSDSNDSMKTVRNQPFSLCPLQLCVTAVASFSETRSSHLTKLIFR